VRSDAVTLDDLAGGITTLEIACRRLDVATEQLGEALSQVRGLTDQRSLAPPPPPRRWWPWWRA
jgi:hypothetical protein